MGQQLIKIAQKLLCFLYIFHIYSLKIFAGGGLGAPHVYAPAFWDPS